MRPQRPRYQREWRQGEDLGLFGPDSIVWRVHRDPASIIGGLRALLIQALHPTAMAAVDKFSDYKSDPWGRLNRTSEYLTVTTFGDTATALAAAERLRAIHRRMSGTDPVTGRAYRVDDADLLQWVHNVEVHSFLAAYRAYGGRLSDADADRYVSEMTAHAELVGLKDHDVPHNMSALRDYLHSFEGMVLTPAARAGVKYILAPPMPLALRPLWAIPAGAAVALLPRNVRDLYGLPWSDVATPVVRLYTRATLTALKTLFPPPPPVREALARAERLTKSAAA